MLCTVSPAVHLQWSCGYIVGSRNLILLFSGQPVCLAALPNMHLCHLVIRSVLSYCFHRWRPSGALLLLRSASFFPAPISHCLYFLYFLVVSCCLVEQILPSCSSLKWSLLVVFCSPICTFEFRSMKYLPLIEFMHWIYRLIWGELTSLSNTRCFLSMSYLISVCRSSYCIQYFYNLPFY